ncbi:MAG: sulfite exporter TauE/SafE family protein [Campylobacterota bacterium]|nr:sulfite exporter TauE/SafE family protein [Campylobacterota bacterium]
MIDYSLYFLSTFILSTIFAIAGLGSAVALVPTLNMIGVSFDIARASGLFVNSISTITISFLNFKNKLFDKDFVAPLVLSSVVFAYFGSKFSLTIDQDVVKNIFGVALIIISTMIFFKPKKKIDTDTNKKKILIFSGAIGGFFSGFLGIGGGSIIAPILFLFGYDPKKVALGISFVIPFSSITAFSTYASVISLDYILLLVVGVAAYFGGLLGNYILVFKISSQMVKNILAIALYLLAFKMLFF